MKKFLKAFWLFCGQVFVPQWGKHPKDYGQDGYLEEMMKKQGELTQEFIVVMTWDERWMERYNEVIDFIQSKHGNPPKYVDAERGLRN